MEYPITLFKGGEAKECKSNGEEAQARAAGFTEPYKYQEYPKHLYKDGAREVHAVTGDEVKAETRVVKDIDEEDAARADGFRMIGEPDPNAPKKDPAPAASTKGASKGK